jgi:hypothetical protein
MAGFVFQMCRELAGARRLQQIRRGIPNSTEGGLDRLQSEGVTWSSIANVVNLVQE